MTTTDERIIQLEMEINGLLKARVAELTQKIQALTVHMLEKERTECLLEEKATRIHDLEEQLEERDREIARLRRESGTLQRRLNEQQKKLK